MKLSKCKNCNAYTLNESCASCKRATGSVHPPKYSKEDKYAVYRRREKYGVLI
ncbi:MAG: nucleolar RNA-binding Nop10p family protein [Candidatus Micrarchaeota archaeon]